MDGPREYCAEINKSDRGRQIPYNFIYMLNLKIKINERGEQKQTHRYREHFDHCQMGEKLWGMGEKVKGLINTNW